jgi:WD40 repeat protein
MDDSVWRKLCKRFPYEPADFRIETVLRRAGPGRPLQCSNPVTALAFSPDSASIAASERGFGSVATDIRVFSVASRELRKICQYHYMGVLDLAFDPGTGLLASASNDHSVVLWELDRNEAIFLVGDPDASISRAAVGFVGTRVIVADGMTFAGERAALTTFDMATGNIRVLLELEEDLGISDLVILPQDELLIAAIDKQRYSGHPEIRCVTINGRERARFQLETSLDDLAAVDARTLVATGRFDHGQTEVFVLDAASGRFKATRTLGWEIGACIASSPAGDRLAVAYDHGVEVCRLKSLKPELQLRLRDEQACSVAWSPDGAWIAVGTVKRTVRLFDAATGIEHLT